MAADGDGEVISYGDVNDEDDDDEMLDMFSFGAETTTTTATSGTDDSTTGNEMSNVDYSNVNKSVMPLPPSSDDHDDKSQASEDSFIELLDQKQKEVTVVDAVSLVSSGINKLTTNTDASTGTDSDMQDILDWLDNDDEQQHQHYDDEEELIFVEPPRPPTLAESVPKPKPPPPPPKEYDSLHEAVKDTDSSLFQIRRALEKEKFVVSNEVRPWLWAKVICGKTLEETLQSSIADSFQQWENDWKDNGRSPLSAVSLQSQDGDGDVANDAAAGTSSATSAKQQRYLLQQSQKREWLETQSKSLASRIAMVASNRDLCQYEQDLLALLMNHEGSKPLEEEEEDGDDNNPSWKDPLLPPIACAILWGGVPTNAAAVMLSQIISKVMPIVSLTMKERVQAAGVLHQQFYLLCSYHLPLLVLHLDKYIPGWYKWPPKGQLPQSWLVSHMAGEAGDGAIMNPQLLVCLWDLILTSSNNSLRFFLVMALLDRYAERLLLLTGEKLKEEFRLVVTFSAKLETDDESDFSVDTAVHISSDQATKYVRLWSDKAQVLWEETPISVAQKLKELEDEAVTYALVARQKVKEEKLRLQEEAEARAQQEAAEAEQEKKENEARLRLTRARLVSFYRQQNPGKETNIDKIMESYQGRYDVLDAKLKQKYGIGFNPALKPALKGNNKLLNSMNSGFGVGARVGFGKRKEEQETFQAKDNVVVEVTASEVLPIVCWSKEANQIKIQKLKKSSKLDNASDERLPLKYYLVDCRPEASSQEQGRIPTSVSFTPDLLTDKVKLKSQEEMFESLRGSVHICVMGEGYAALPELYGHKMTKGLSEFMKEDEVRIYNCALFFLSRGFPFVSILEGGFAAAHAYLCQEGPKKHLYARNVLTDYDPEVSIFAQFERATNSTSREKAQRSLQHMFDSGITALTKSTMRFETLSSETSKADETSHPKLEQMNVVRNFFGGKKEAPVHESRVNSEANLGDQPLQQHVPFRNPFAWKSQTHSELNQSSHRDSSTKSVNSETQGIEEESVPCDSSLEEQATKEETSGLKANSRPFGASQKAGGFAGLGAALNNSIKSSGKAQNARNPFARFGNLGTNAGGKNKEGKGPGLGNHFAGLNQFRKNVMKTSESHPGPEIATQATMVALPPEPAADNNTAEDSVVLPVPPELPKSDVDQKETIAAEISKI